MMFYLKKKQTQNDKNKVKTKLTMIFLKFGSSDVICSLVGFVWHQKFDDPISVT